MIYIYIWGKNIYIIYLSIYRNVYYVYAKQVLQKQTKNNLSFNRCKFLFVIFLVYCIFCCCLPIDPSVGRHLCFERDKKRYRGTKNDIISRDICHRVIALIKAQVCDKYIYICVYMYTYIHIYTYI